MSRSLKVAVFYGYLFDNEDVSEEIVDGHIPAELDWQYFGCLDYEDSPLALVVKKSQASRAGGALELSGGIADDTMDTRDWEDMLLRYLESAGFPDPQDTPRWYAVPIYG